MTAVATSEPSAATATDARKAGRWLFVATRHPALRLGAVPDLSFDRERAVRARGGHRFSQAIFPVLRLRQPFLLRQFRRALPGRCGIRCLWRALTMVLSIGFGAPAGYALSRFDFPGKEAFRFLVLMTRAFPLPLLALPLAVMFIRTGLDDTGFGPRACSHDTGAALCRTDHLLAVFRHSDRVGGGRLDTRLQPAPGFQESHPAAGAARHRGVRGLCLHHLMERGIRRRRSDHREPDADGVPAAEPRRIAALSEIRRRGGSGHSGADLHLRGEKISFRHVGHSQPLTTGGRANG